MNIPRRVNRRPELENRGRNEKVIFEEQSINQANWREYWGEHWFFKRGDKLNLGSV